MALTTPANELSLATATAPDGSRAARVTGRVMTGLVAAFLAMDAAGKLLELAPVVEGTRQVGFPVASVFWLGLVLAACLLLYLLPWTSVLGAVLLTGYLGGAVATNLRAGGPLFTHLLFPVYVGILVWGGLFLRDARLRALFPVRAR